MTWPEQWVPYVPSWPAYLAERLPDGGKIVDVTGEEFVPEDHGMVVYRLLTYRFGAELALILPVPDDLDDPLSHPAVRLVIEDAVLRAGRPPD